MDRQRAKRHRAGVRYRDQRRHQYDRDHVFAKHHAEHQLPNPGIHPVLVVVVVAGKIVSVSLASIAIGERPDTALKSGFAMAQIGVFSILIAEVGSGATDTHSFLYTLAVGVVATTAFLCPFLIRASTPAADWLDRHLPVRVQKVLSQYGAWLDRTRKLPQTEGIERGKAG